MLTYNYNIMMKCFETESWVPLYYCDWLFSQTTLIDLIHELDLWSFSMPQCHVAYSHLYLSQSFGHITSAATCLSSFA